MLELFDELMNNKYLNLATFQMIGERVKTPVWFAQDGDKINVQAVSNTGKVKRIYISGRINIATCKWMERELAPGFLHRHAKLLIQKFIW